MSSGRKEPKLRETISFVDETVDKYLLIAWGSNKYGELSLSEHSIKNSILVEQ